MILYGKMGESLVVLGLNRHSAWNNRYAPAALGRRRSLLVIMKGATTLTHSIAAGSERLRYKWPGRIAWAAVALPVIWLSAAGIPFRYTQLLKQNQWFQSELGLHSSPEFAALVVLLLELFVGLVFFLSSALFA